MMSEAPAPIQPPAERVSPFYKIGLVVVLLLDGALAVPFAYFRSNRPANHTLADVIGET